MLYNNITKELLGLQDVELKKVENKNDKISIHIEMNRKKQKCPCCSVETSTIHDYRIQTVKDISAFGKNICLVLRKRRYRCNNCNKRFYESNTFLAKYKRMTNRLIFHITPLMKISIPISTRMIPPITGAQRSSFVPSFRPR